MSMVRQTVILCNVCGKSPAEDVEITLGEVTRTVDLCEEHMKPIRKVFETGDVSAAQDGISFGTFMGMGDNN